MANRLAFLVRPKRIILILLAVMCLPVPVEAQHGGGGGHSAGGHFGGGHSSGRHTGGAARGGGMSAGYTLVLEIDLRGVRGDLERSALRMSRANRPNW
jgi:hypothetical protein